MISMISNTIDNGQHRRRDGQQSWKNFNSDGRHADLDLDLDGTGDKHRLATGPDLDGRVWRHRRERAGRWRAGEGRALVLGSMH